MHKINAFEIVQSGYVTIFIKCKSEMLISCHTISYYRLIVHMTS
jgi:hypothetical protein